ncbi:MAG: radical SAM protein, partial [Clostridia bacterium]|nr:radical SAM protein [Clostridia bacterium]
MHYTKPVFRPAFEGDVPLLQVTDGCSYNKCSFCSMYRTVPFRVSPDEEVEEDLRELRSMYRHMPRLFLVNGDPFCLSTERLAKLGERIRYYFPECETISCFAHIPNFRSKTVDDLKLLRSLGFDQINIGVESAIDSVLDMFHKGYHVDDVYEQLGKLNEAGMQFSMNIIMGALGNGEYEALAKANADLLNATQPYLIFTTTLYSLPGSELYDYMEGGNFQSNTYRQLILEQIDMLSQLRLRNTYYYGLHPANPIPFDG